MQKGKTYTVKALAELAGVTPRTLRYYDKINLLKPDSSSPAGYRLYGQKEVARLQQILFYRTLGFPLEKIAETLNAATFNQLTALKEHLSGLCARREQLECLIETVQKTIAYEEGKTDMADKEKFQGFMKEKIAENERVYGTEVRERYGDTVMNRANAKLMGLSQSEFDDMQRLDREIRTALETAVQTGSSPSGEEGRQIALLHRDWLSYTWPAYSLEMHKGLADGYLADERFQAYYDRRVAGCTQFLRDAIHTL